MQNEKEKIQIEYIKTSLLKFYPGNPRIWNDKGKDDLKRSISRNGWLSPLLIEMSPGREYTVLSGNMRLELAQEMGFKEVPCVKVVIDDPEKEREIVLRMNVLNGDWNYELLKNFEIGTLLEAGFDEKQLSDIWSDILGIEEDEFDVEQELQKIVTPQTKLGEIYSLGNHVLGCGDATNPEFVKRLLDGTKVDLIYCDPVYNLGISYNFGISGHGQYGGSVNDQKSDTEYKEFLKKTIENALTVSKDDCHIFYYCDQKYIGLLQEIFREVGLDNKRVCLWVKNGFNVTPQVAFNKAYEPCVYATKGSPYLAPINNLNEILNKEIASGNRTIDDIVDLFDIWLARRLPGNQYSHPTEKPLTLHEKPLKRCTKVNDVVLDLFSGSFSTGISCEMLKRRAFACDIDPVFVDLGIRRFEKYSGIKAKSISKRKE